MSTKDEMLSMAKVIEDMTVDEQMAMAHCTEQLFAMVQEHGFPAHAAMMYVDLHLWLEIEAAANNKEEAQ